LSISFQLFFSLYLRFIQFFRHNFYWTSLFLSLVPYREQSTVAAAPKSGIVSNAAGYYFIDPFLFHKIFMNSFVNYEKNANVNFGFSY